MCSYVSLRGPMHARMPFCHHGLSPYSSSVSASTAAQLGAHAPTAPSCCTARAAAAHPTCSAATTPPPRAHTRRNPALNASPAPLVSSTLDTVHAGTCHRSPEASPASTPMAPRLMTTSPTPPPALLLPPSPPPSPLMPLPRSTSRASSAVFFPVISHASTSEGINTSTADGPLTMLIIAAGVHSPAASKFGSIETLISRPLSRLTASGSPACKPLHT
mmetsp:Transcript_37508/g.93233  ORF Transcript_37508/g.93233 Transcript_37508/m.93233 type:complete len:218 (-) Transcript_37508:502-1155(-)